MKRTTRSPRHISTRTNPGNFWHVRMRGTRGKRVIGTIHFGPKILARIYRKVGEGSKVFSLLFPKDAYSAKQAGAWATKHGFSWMEVLG